MWCWWHLEGEGDDAGVSPQATEVTERSTVLVVAVAVGALVTLVLLPQPGRGIEYTRPARGERRPIYPRTSV